MKRVLPARLCYGLLVACVVTSMVCVMWLPRAVEACLGNNLPAVLHLVRSLRPYFPGWSQYFCVQTLAAVIAICAAVYWVSGGERWLQRSPLNWRHLFPGLVGAYALWAALSYLWSAWPYGTRGYVLRELPFYFLCVVAMFACKKEGRWLVLAKAFVTAAFVQAALQTYLIFETLGANAQLQRVFLEHPPSFIHNLSLIGIAGLLLCLCGAGMFIRAGDRRWQVSGKHFLIMAFLGALTLAFVTAGIYRAYHGPLERAFRQRAAFYGNPNFGSSILLTACLISVGFILHGSHCLLAAPATDRRGTGRMDSPARSAFTVVASVAALGLFGFVLLTARSLAGALAAGAAGLAYLICILPLKRKGLIVLALVTVAVGGVLFVFGFDQPRRQAFRAALEPRSTAHLRTIYWVTAGQLVARRPLAGWGMGSFAATYPSFKPPLAAKLPFTSDVRPTHPHNEFIRIASEQGMVGLLLYLGILTFAFAASYMGLRRKPLKLRLVGYGMWAGALAFTVQQAFGKAPMHWSFAANYWILLGVMAAACHWLGRAEASGPTEGRGGIMPAGWLTLAAVVGVTGWAWWTWAVGGYESMVHLRQAIYFQRQMRVPEKAWEHFDKFRAFASKVRRRCLWPDEVLHHDYVVGWFLRSHGRWASAARQLEEVQKTAPDFRETRLFLAECYRRMGRRREAQTQLMEYLRRDPYSLEAYHVLALIHPGTATDALEGHVVSRLTEQQAQVVQDYPTAEEVLMLLDLYTKEAQWERARDFVGRARTFYAAAQVPNEVDVHHQLRRLARLYRNAGQGELASALGAAFPEAFKDRPEPAE